jgi:dTMP kinase
MRGLFITLEGLDGCGKSTQVQMLAEALRRRGFDVVVTREPGGTPLGERMREVLLSDSSHRLTAEAELLLMAADRSQDVAQVIRPALEAGRIVVADRYTDSTVAFQGYGRGLDLAMVAEINRFATGGLTPDLTLLFDIDPLEAQRRLEGRRTGELGMSRFDNEELEFHHRVREGYLELATAEPTRVRVIDATQNLEATFRQGMLAVMELAAQRGFSGRG